MFKYDFFVQILFFLRDLFSKRLYEALLRFCRGQVLDVGGATFYETAIKKKIPFDTWTVVETTDFKPKNLPNNVKFLVEDGTQLSFKDNTFDTILNVQVLEHTFEPYKMFSECVRVLKKGGYGVFLVPQTGSMHLSPHHYQNFLRFWLIEACKRSNVEVVQLSPLGGLWTTQGSRLFYMFLSALKRPGNTFPEVVRNAAFYVLFPFMALYAVINIPICLLFSLGDLQEEPPNHLLVIRK